MKKFLKVLLLSVMALTFAACGNDKADEAAISRGTTTDTTYENEFAGIGWNLLDGWVFATKSQMEQMNQAVLDMLEGDIDKNLAEGSVFCDLYAQDINGNNVNIQFEKLNTVNSILVTEESYLELSLDALKQTYESMGYTDVSLSLTTTKIGDNEQPSITSKCTYQGITVSQKMAVIKEGNYMCIITASSQSESVIDDILSSFYTLEK